MRKKLLAILMILAMIATVFAGCSDSSDRDEREKDRKESRNDREDDDEDDEDADIDLGAVFDKLFGKDDDDRDDDRDDDDDENDDFFFGKQDSEKEEKVINVMSFTDEVPNMVQKYLDMHPELGYTLRSTIVATTDGTYQPALDELLKAGGTDAPDIYALETAFVYKYTQGDAAFFAASYDDLGIQTDRMIQESKTAPYAVEVGTRPSDGKVVALPYEGTGGCFIYRRSIAEEVWGTDDPAVVQMKIGGGSGNWDRFWEAAEELKAHGFGIVSGDGDVWHAIENSADEAWIVDGQLVMDPKRESLLDFSAKLKDNNYHNETQDWMDAWFADIRGEGAKEVLGFFGPAWLINYTMAHNSDDTYGDWAVCNSPVGFFWGGTWVAASKDVVKKEKKDVVADIIQWITLDYDENSLQYMWANGTYYGYNGTRDTVVSGTVMEKSDGSIDFLGGQNMFDYFVSANEYARGDNLSQYDELINFAWRNAVRDYVAGYVDRDGAIAQFADDVRSKLGVTVSDDFYYNGSDSGADYDYDFGYDYDW